MPSHPENIEVSKVMDQATSLWKAVQNDLMPEYSYPVGGLEIFDKLITREVRAIQGKSGVGCGRWPRTHLGPALLERKPYQEDTNSGIIINKLSLTVSDWTCRDWRIEVLQTEIPGSRKLSIVKVTFQEYTSSFIPAEFAQA